jgi:hypothetical protein
MLDMGSPVVDRGGIMSWLKYDRQLGIRAEPMTKDNLMAEMYATTDCLIQKCETALDRNGNEIIDKDTGKPLSRIVPVIGDVHHRVIGTAYGLRESGLWKLRGTLTHPIINRNGNYVIRNGLYWKDADVNGAAVKEARIHLADGYDPVSEYFFAISDPVLKELEGIQDKAPSKEEVSEALAFIDKFLCDFTFATESARASAVAFMMTMLCREMIEEASVPMLEIRAPEPQSGKSLLAKMAIGSVTGEKPLPFSPNFRDVPEFEKELFSQLMRGRNYIFMDNVYGKVQSSFLDMALTTGYIEKRLLGVNMMATVYSGMPFVMTANNPKLSEDVKNRIYLLDILKPPEGKVFEHRLPEKEAREMQPKMLRALFTLYNHWDKNEKRWPFMERRIDGFIQWSQIIGGILEAAGIKGFLEDTLKQIKEIDPKLEQAADFARLWYEAQGSGWLFVKDTFELAQKAGYVKEDESYQQKLQKIAAILENLRRRELPDGFYFQRSEGRGSEWRVCKDAGSGN